MLTLSRSSSSVGPSQSKSSGAVKLAHTCFFAYHCNEFTVYFTDEVCKNDAHMHVQLVAGLLLFRGLCRRLDDS